MSYILGIDQGTTSSRVVLFDKEGQKKFSKQMEFEQIYPQAGWTEHSPNAILDSVVKCAAGALLKAEASKTDIAAIGITNQRETTVAWDRETGEPLYNAVVWLDLRTADTVKKLIEKFGSKDYFRPTVGLPISTYFSAVKMVWMLENVPEVKAAADAGRLCFGTIESWLIYKLTGGKDGGIHVTDVSNAARYMLMNLQTTQWDEKVCGELGIPINALPKIVSNAEVYGKVKDLDILEGIAISGSLGDQHAALVGQGCLQVGQSKNTYGTGCFMLINTGAEIIPSKNGLLTTVAYKLGKDAPVTYALEGSIACAGRTIQWLRDGLGLVKDAAETEALASSVDSTGGVTMVPAFSGLFAPYWREDARAIIVGMTLFTKREHIVRAALDSVAMSTVDVMNAMKQDTGKDLGTMYVDGGMTANNFLMQRQANVLGCKVMRAKMPEATVLGAAVAAGLATGFYQKVEDIREFLEKAGGHESFEPKTSAEERSKEQAVWKDAITRSYGLAAM